MKKVTLIIFSPTGGTAKCAKAVANSIGIVETTIDLTSRDLKATEVNPDSISIIAVPSYSGRVPALAVERLKKLKGNGSQTVLMAVYGNRAFEDTLVELEDVAKECGFKILAGISAVSRHSIVRKIATYRPDKQDLEVLKDFASQIMVKLSSVETNSDSNSNSDSVLEAKIPGNRPYRKSGPGLTPKTNKKCNDCGKCADQCPSGAISKDDPKKINKDVCIQCVRCVEVCPIGAKYLPPLMVSIVGLVLNKPCRDRKEPELFL